MIYMLVAILRNGEKVNVAAPYWSTERLLKLKEEHAFFCPACKEPVKLKIGKIKIPHFAHLTASCQADSEAESTYHLNGKKQLYVWLKRQRLAAEVEKFIPSIAQRADLFVSFQHKRYAIEYQCSNIPPDQVIKRTNGYKKERIKPIWILGWKQMKQVGEHQYRLTPFHCQFLHSPQNDHPFIINYCSDKKTFIFFSHLIPFSKQNIFAASAMISPESFFFRDCLQGKSLAANGLWKHWLKKISQYRLKPLFQKTNEERKLQKKVYETVGLSLSQLPVEAFIPLKSGYMVDEAVYIWQCSVLLFIETLRADEVFHAEKLVWHLKKIGMKERSCSVKTDLKKPIIEYLTTLSHFKFLQPIGPYSFRKTSSPFHLESMEKREQRLGHYLDKEGMFFSAEE
ncbi:competence protein CoiA family protein [Aeribacillus pallidus]